MEGGASQVAREQCIIVQPRHDLRLPYLNCPSSSSSSPFSLGPASLSPSLLKEGFRFRGANRPALSSSCWLPHLRAPHIWQQPCGKGGGAAVGGMRDVVAGGRQGGEGGGGGSGAASPPCAACKLLRRRCAPMCVFAPYFPPGEPHKFANVHKVFGASNVSKLLQEIPVEHRGDAVSSLVYEANARVRDPIYGCVGAISSLQQQVESLQAQLALAQAEMVRLKMRNACAAHHRLGARGGGGGSSSAGSPSSMSSPKTEPQCKPTPELDMVVDQPGMMELECSPFWSY